MSQYVFYKSFLNHWMAFGVKSNDGEVWYSYDGIRFYPLEVSINTERVCLEYPHGPDYWRGSIGLDSLASGNQVELNLVSSSKAKPIFRLQKEITHSVIFDHDPKFRVIRNLYQLAGGRVLCLTAFNGRHYSAKTLKLYLQKDRSYEYIECNILSLSSDAHVIHTDQGDLDFLAGTWEGYGLTNLPIEQYSFAEKETEFFLAKK